MISIMSPEFRFMLMELPGSEQSLRSGDFLFRRGDDVRALHHVIGGEVHVLRHGEDGGVVILQRAKPGGLVSEPSAHSVRYHCDAVAVAPTRTRAIRKSSLLAALRKDVDFATGWIAHLAHEVQSARAKAEILSLHTVAARLDAWLELNGVKLPEKGEGKALAGELAVSPEALYREIAKRRRSTASG